MSQNIYITGGASGLGKALAEYYLRDGHNVALFDLQAGDEAVTSLSVSTGCDKSAIQFYQLDITDNMAVQHAFDQAAQHNSPDTVINCAGICQAVPFVEHEAEQFNRLININLLGSRNIAEAATKHLSKGGHLVLFGSMASILSCYGYSAYGASKFAVRGLAEVLRIELKPKGIAVSLVCPPEVDTPMVQNERLHRPVETGEMKQVAGSFTLEEASKRIYKAIPSKKFLIMINTKAKFLAFITGALPDGLNHLVTDKILSGIQKKNR